MEDKGYQVSTAEDGLEAIEKAKGTHFDIIFMDVKLPKMNELEAFKSIKEVEPEVAVIMMTAYSVKDLLKEAV